MKLAGLQIDRFGARTGLNLNEIADQLNVVYGPNGSGKTTVIQFIRWMIYGQCDEISRPYLATAEGSARGAMTIADGYGQRTLHRHTQSGSLLSQLSTDDTNASTTNLNKISNSEFDQFFVVSFDQPRTLGDLLNAARTHGFQLHIDQRQLDRIRELTEQLNQHRSELTRFAHFGTVESLRARREEKRREIESIRVEWQRRREEIERQRHEAAAALSEQQMLCDRLRSVVANVESAIETRKRQLAEEHAQWLAARRDSEQHREQRIRELDAAVNRWQEILSEVRARLEQVRARISSFGDVGFSATEATDLHFFMRKLGFRIRDIEQDLQGVYESETWRDHEADADYLRGLLGSALNSMQGDVTRLAQTVERQQQTNELHECREELTYLCRVEHELSDMLEALARQRNNLGRESSFLPENATRYDVASVSAIDLATALDDFRLRHLVERRDVAKKRLNEAELELTNRQRRLREIEEQLTRFDANGRIGALEREIGEIDEQIRQIELRAVLERQIESIEEELRRAREYSGRSEICDEATKILRRLTTNDYRSVRVTDNFECEVERADGKVFTYPQLSRGVQDQVYLSISLAIVSAFGRKGTSMPLILNDIFVNLDESGIHALSQLLSDFAGGGQQILVFTRHAHIRELFKNGATKLFQLSDLDSQRKPLYLPTPPRQVSSPVIEPVRVRNDLEPQPEDPTYKWVAEWHRRDPIHPMPPAPLMPPTKPSTPFPESPDAPTTFEPPPEPESRRNPIITLDSPLTKAPTLAEDLVRLLAELDLHHVRDFVGYDPDAIADRLAENGVTAEMVQRRQRELLMLAYLGVSVLDAQLLVACGVPDPARLSRADEAVLLKRVETILERPQATARFGNFSQYGLARIRRWIDLAKSSDFRGKNRRSYSQGHRNPRDMKASSRSGTSSRSNGNGNETRVQKPRPTTRAKKAAAARPTATTKIKFYLEVNDPVVDAPSIGPKTATKLNEVGIYTVDNLLDADPASTASRLDDKKISADTVEQWQLQSQLVCRIPNLRGHDAQILVACGVEDPDTLASMDAATFLKQVKKFVATKDGQRVVRNNKKPDLAEVAAWIEWSDGARDLYAA